MLSWSGLMSREMPWKSSKTLFLKHQYSITLIRVTQQRVKKMRPRMGLAFYWCSMVNQWHLEVRRSHWQRGSIHRSGGKFWRRVLAWSVSTNMEGFFAAEDDLLTEIHLRRSRGASSTSVSKSSNIILTTRKSKAQSLSVTLDRPQVIQDWKLDLDGCQIQRAWLQTTVLTHLPLVSSKSRCKNLSVTIRHANFAS